MERSCYFPAAGTKRIDDIEDVGKSDRRGAERYRTVCRIARVQRADDVGLWRVRNISDNGLMLAADTPATVGETLDIALSETTTIRGTVIWAGAGRCGVAFDRPIDAAEVLRGLADEQRAGRPVCGSQTRVDRPERLATVEERPGSLLVSEGRGL